ncbi:MAG: phosphoribosylamine--glycine ligase, partial [Verrucomicrobia bacterium]
GRAEAGHVALVAGGRVVPLITNQEYKRAFDGNQGIVAGAPLGGLVERDPDDRHGLARALIEPLAPWFREVGYRGPVQVTAVRHDGRWHVIEYNVRLGVTSGPLLLRLLENPLEVLLAAARGETPRPRWRRGLRFGASITLAGYGYPYVQIEGPELPVEVTGPPPPNTWLWWGEVRRDRRGRLRATGHRLLDAAAVARTLPAALAAAYAAIRQVRVPGAYHRLDIGRSLWPPGAS